MSSADRGFGPQDAFTCCVKIATQLLSTTPSPVTKTGDSLDNVAAFQGILTVATAKEASSDDIPQTKSKFQAQDAKSQASDSRKKFVTSELTTVAIPVREVPALKQLPANTILHIASSLTPNQATPSQSSSQTLDDSHACAELADGRGLFKSSTTSVSTVVQLSADISTAKSNDQKAIGGTLREATPPKDTPMLLAAEDPERIFNSATSSHSEVQPTQVVANQPNQSNEQTPSTTAVAMPLIQLLPPAATAPISAASVMDAKSVSAAPHTLPSVVLPEPVLASGIASASPTAAAAPIAAAPIAVVKTVPATSITIPAIASSAPIASAKTDFALPAAVPPVGSQDIVPAPLVPVQSVGSAVTVAAEPVVSAMPVSQPIALKARTTEQTAAASKAVDRSNASAAVPLVDSKTLSKQQAAAAVVQSVAMPVSFPGFSLVGESQATSVAAATRTRIAGRVPDTITEASSRQNNSAAKVRSGSAMSASGNRFANSDGSDSETETTSTSAVSPLPKVVEASEMPNQGASDSKMSGITNLQQVLQPIPTDSATHSSQSSQSVSATAEATVQTVPAQANPDSQPMQGVSSAQLIQSMHSSEMKLGMQSAEFGNISINTSLNHQALSAQISIDHSELGRALAMHLPAIEERLGSAYGVQARVELRDNNNPSPSSNSGYSNSGQQSREQRQSQSGGTTASQSATPERNTTSASFTSVSRTATASRLDIRI